MNTDGHGFSIAAKHAENAKGLLVAPGRAKSQPPIEADERLLKPI